MSYVFNGIKYIWITFMLVPKTKVSELLCILSSMSELEASKIKHVSYLLSPISENERRKTMEKISTLEVAEHSPV